MSRFTDLKLPRKTPVTIEEYEESGAWGQETVIDRLNAIVKEHPDARVFGPHRTITYQDLKTEVDKLSAGLQELGISEGDIISYQLPNWVETIITHLALSQIGAIANPIVPIYRHSELRYFLSDSESEFIIIPDTFNDFDYLEMIDDIASDCPHLQAAIVLGGEEPTVDSELETISYSSLTATDPSTLEPATPDPNDIHALIYTSGTTSDPKGVLHTHNTLLYEEQTTVELLGLSSQTTVFMASPVTHITGVVYALEMPFLEGMDVVMMDKWDPEKAVELIDEYTCNFTVAATPFLQGIHDAAPDNWDNSLRVFGCGGADIPPELVRKASEKLNCTVQRVYGSTEYPTATWPPLDTPVEKLAETDGCPAPGVQMKIVDVESGEELPTGETGEILVHGPEMMVGYASADLNEDAFDGEWFQTGDLGVLDEDGFLEVTGRKKDIIIRGGENIPVKEVEDKLYEHPAIEDIAVVAMPDEKLQEKGCAYVKVEEGEDLTFDEMIDWLDKKQMAKQKYPERLEIIDEFPQTASGKVKKSVLRERIADKLGMEPVTRE